MLQTMPHWLATEIKTVKKGLRKQSVQRTLELLKRSRVPTVCQEARCPNRGVCFSNGTATFMILGHTCTRGCRFCAIAHNKRAEPVDETEPERLALAVAELGIRHAVITSVTRDDLLDGGARHYVKTVTMLREKAPKTTIELLTPDFNGSREALGSVISVSPNIIAHNLDTVARLHRTIKPRANYELSLKFLRWAKEISPNMITKSGIMLGMGETREEVAEELTRLREIGCNMVTLGQYLAPSAGHAPVVRFIEPEEFIFWENFSKELGFESVASGALVRSSLNASVSFDELS